MSDDPSPRRDGGLRHVLRVPELRRIQLSWGISKCAFWGWITTMNAIAFSEGGAWAVGVFLALRVTPGGLLTPLVSLLSERCGLLRGLSVLAWIRTATMAATAVLALLDAPIAALIAISAFEGLGSQPQDPMHVRALPWLARSTEQLTVANGLTEILRMGGVLLGPAVATVLLLVADPKISLIVFTGGGLLSAVCLRSLRDAVAPVPKSDTQSVFQDLRQGARGVFGDRDIRTLVGWIAWAAMCTGTLQVYMTELSMHQLDLGNSGPSISTGLFGLGGFLGGFATLLFAGRKNLTLPVVSAAVALGVFFSSMGVLPAQPPVLAFTSLIGISVVILMVSSATLMQRGIPLRLQAAAFGINALIGTVAFGIAGLLASTLVALVGLRPAIVFTGLSMVATTWLAFPSLRRFASRANAHEQEVKILQQTLVFRVLPIAPLERVASVLERLELVEGQSVVHQGEPGEDLFIVEKGRLAVLVDGVEVNALEKGDVFGEIALLQNIPRTATVVAREPGEVYRLNRDDFMLALDASPDCRRFAQALSTQRLQKSPESRTSPRENRDERANDKTSE